MIVIDTTVLVYAVGGAHPLAGPCRGLVEMVGRRALTATTTVEVIQEFTHVRARRRGRRDAAELARRYVTLLSPLLEPDAEDLRAGLDLFETEEELGAFDAVLVATAVRAGASALASADQGLAALESPTVLDPGEDGFLRRLERLERA